MVGRPSRLLLSALGAFEVLMAARATPALLVVGLVGGIALVAVAIALPLIRRDHLPGQPQ